MKVINTLEKLYDLMDKTPSTMYNATLIGFNFSKGSDPYKALEEIKVFEKVNFINCTFGINEKGGYDSESITIGIAGDISFINCDFTGSNRLNIYSSFDSTDYNIRIRGCTFNNLFIMCDFDHLGIVDSTMAYLDLPNNLHTEIPIIGSDIDTINFNFINVSTHFGLSLKNSTLKEIKTNPHKILWFREISSSSPNNYYLFKKSEYKIWSDNNRFANCNLDNADFSNFLTLGYMQFTGCSVHNADFSGMGHLKYRTEFYMSFIDCTGVDSIILPESFERQDDENGSNFITIRQKS